MAVAAIGTGRTAIGILEVAELRPDDVVLVTAAAGAGRTLPARRRRAGAFSIGAAGGEEKVARLDADLAVDYSKDGWDDELRGRRVTVVLDGVGGELGRAALELLSPGGRIVLFGFASGSPTQIHHQRPPHRLGIRADAAIGPCSSRRAACASSRAAALRPAAEGRLVPQIGHRFRSPRRPRPTARWRRGGRSARWCWCLRGTRPPSPGDARRVSSRTRSGTLSLLKRSELVPEASHRVVEQEVSPAHPGHA